MTNEDKQPLLKGCKYCWHNYHCPMPQEGYDYNPDTCPYNPDNKRENHDTGRKTATIDRP